MMVSHEQFTSATKSHFDTQLTYFNSISNEILRNFQKIAELNIATAKTLVEESTLVAKTMLDAKDLQEQFNLLSKQSKQTPDKFLAYAGHLSAIVSGMHTELSSATENQVNTQGQKLTGLVDEMGKNAPAGSEQVISAVKSAINSSNQNYEKFNKSTKHMVDALQKNLNVASSQLVQNVASEQTREFSGASTVNS